MISGLKAWAIFIRLLKRTKTLLFPSRILDPVATAPGTDMLLMTITPSLTVGY
jgi:hypothetical protein